MATFLKRRGNTWYVQKRVPKHLQDVIGSKMIYRALGTSDRRVAESRRHAVLAEIIADFKRAEGSLDAHPASPAWVQQVARDLRHAVTRGGEDSEVAAEMIQQIIDQHLKAAGLTRETASEAHAKTLRSAVDSIANPDRLPFSEAVAA